MYSTKWKYYHERCFSGRDFKENEKQGDEGAKECGVLNIFVMYVVGKEHQYKPLVLTIAGAMCIIVNRMWLDLSVLIVVGMSLLIIGGAWNSLSKLMTLSVKNFAFSLWKSSKTERHSQ